MEQRKTKQSAADELPEQAIGRTQENTKEL
jgi:hypothetical protein